MQGVSSVPLHLCLSLHGERHIGLQPVWVTDANLPLALICTSNLKAFLSSKLHALSCMHLTVCKCFADQQPLCIQAVLAYQQ